MADIESVVKGLNDIGAFIASRLGYEQARNYFKTIDNAIAMLKEQEAVEPVNIRWEMGINGGNCPKCMNWVQRTYNYCPFCGKAVKWNE